MAVIYIKRRIAEVTKISEVDAIWTFLTEYDGSSLGETDMDELRCLLKDRVLYYLMTDRHTSDHRYFKLS